MSFSSGTRGWPSRSRCGRSSATTRPGNLAALIAYSALVAIFPLLLVLVTVLDIVLKNDPELKQKVLNAVDKYPAISLLGDTSAG